MDADMLDLCAIGVVTAAALISSAEKTLCTVRLPMSSCSVFFLVLRHHPRRGAPLPGTRPTVDRGHASPTAPGPFNR